MDTDDWARRMEHRTAGIAAVKRRAKDSGLSRFERWAGSTGCPLRAGYMNPGAGRALRERCSTSSSIETMALLGVSTKCACVDKWLLHNGLAPMATVPSKSSVTLSTDLRGFFERRSSDGTRLAGVLVLVTVSAVAFEARGRGQSRARWVSLRVFPSGPWLPASAPRRRLRVSATFGSTSFLCGRSWLIFRSAGRGCPRSCRRPRHLCTPRLGSMPPCGNTCQSICGTGAASCSRRCGATASHLSMQPVRELCQTVSARLRHFSITSDRTNGRQRNPRRTMDIFGKKVNKTGRRKDDAVKAAQTEQEAAAAKQDGDERAESQPQRRRRCTGPRRPRTRTSCATFW